jgi:hypothetical protein
MTYTELPNSISDGRCYLSVNGNQNSLVEKAPMWVASSISRTSFVYPLFTNASLQGRVILIGFKHT